MTPDELILHWRFRVHRVQLAHYASARKFENRHLQLGLPAVILSTIVGTSVFAALSKSVKPWLQITVGMLSVLSAVLVSLQTFLRHSELAEKHRVVGARFASLKHQIELLIAIPEVNSEKLKESLAAIEAHWKKLREESPSIPADAWNHVERTLTFEEHAKRYPLFVKDT